MAWNEARVWLAPEGVAPILSASSGSQGSVQLLDFQRQPGATLPTCSDVAAWLHERGFTQPEPDVFLGEGVSVEVGGEEGADALLYVRLTFEVVQPHARRIATATDLRRWDELVQDLSPRFNLRVIDLAEQRAVASSEFVRIFRSSPICEGVVFRQ